MPPEPSIDRWLEQLEERHLEELTFSEVRRSIQAVSRGYIHASRESRGVRALDGRGKRAAFGLFYAPLHLLTVRHIVTELGIGGSGPLLDLGCGTGVAGAGWALAADEPTKIEGIDLSRWALDEALWNWKQLGVDGETRRGNLLETGPRTPPDRIVLGWTVNELKSDERTALKRRLRARIAAGCEVLILEPIARRLTPWWNDWTEGLGGQADEWRFSVKLPKRLAELDRAAGLDHRELTAKSLWVKSRREASPPPAQK